MSLNDILQKITEEASKKSAFMKQVAIKEIKKIQEEAQARADNRKMEIEEKIEINSASIIKKSKTLAKMAGRSQMLKEKRMIIDRAYEEAEKDLDALDGNDYTKLMVEMLEHVMKSTPKGSLIIPAGKRNQTEEAIEKAKADFEIKSETSDFKGGFVLVSGNVEINLSFPYLIQKIVRPHTELDVAKILFP